MAANPSTKNAHEQLIERLLADLPTGHTTATVKLPNRTFDTPDASKWLRVTVINQTADNVQAGGLWKRYEFLFVVDLFYPTGDDTLVQLTEAEEIAATFENQKFLGVNCQEALITEPGEDGSWYMVQVSIDGYYEGNI